MRAKVMMKVKLCRPSAIGKAVTVLWYIFGSEYLATDRLVRIRGHHIKGGVAWNIKLMGYTACCLGPGKANSGKRFPYKSSHHHQLMKDDEIGIWDRMWRGALLSS